MADLNWSDAQWQRVNDCVTDAFGKANVATSFLPCYGPLSGSTETVRNERLREQRPDEHTTPIVSLDSDHDAVNLKLLNLTVKVELSSEQVVDETLSNGLLAFRRAANILAQETDLIGFEGYLRGGPISRYLVNRVPAQKGMADLELRRSFPLLSLGVPTGQAVVPAVVNAIQTLEDRMHPGPFACVLGTELFEAVHDPSPSLVLPADRIVPLLKGGSLLRSGQMDDGTGIVVSLAGQAIDVVVGTPPSVQFLQRTADARFLFRVYKRFVLRIRDQERLPIAGFTIRPPNGGPSGAQTLVDLAEADNEPSAAKLELAQARLEEAKLTSDE